jgi:hypothetical protein
VVLWEPFVAVLDPVDETRWEILQGEGDGPREGEAVRCHIVRLKVFWLGRNH